MHTYTYCIAILSPDANNILSIRQSDNVDYRSRVHKSLNHLMSLLFWIQMASPKIEFYVKLQSGKTITLRLFLRQRVEDIINEVSKVICPPNDHRVRIKYEKKILDETKTIGYLGIFPETILKAEVSTQGPVINISWKRRKAPRKLPINHPEGGGKHLGICQETILNTEVSISKSARKRSR